MKEDPRIQAVRDAAASALVELEKYFKSPDVKLTFVARMPNGYVIVTSDDLIEVIKTFTTAHEKEQSGERLSKPVFT